MWDPQVSQPYRPPWPVMGIALLLLYGVCLADTLHGLDDSFDFQFG
jgi:hypothetical protein